MQLNNYGKTMNDIQLGRKLFLSLIPHNCRLTVKFALLLILPHANAANLIDLTTNEASQYQWLYKPNNNKLVCVVLPQIQNPYWLAVNHGLVKQARLTDTPLHILTMGNQQTSNRQKYLINQCYKKRASAVLIAKVFSESQAVRRNNKLSIPLVGLGKEIDQQKFNGQVAYNPNRMLSALGQYASQRAQKENKHYKVAIFPGKQGDFWTDQLLETMEQVDALSPNISLLWVGYGQTDYTNQSIAINETLEQLDELDINLFIGPPAMAKAASKILSVRQKQHKIEVFSLRFTPELLREIKRGRIQAAAMSKPVTMARIALDMAVKASKNKPTQQLLIAPSIINQQNWQTIELSESVAPYGFRATLDVN